MKDHTLTDKARGEILSICKEVAFPNDFVAALFYGSHVWGYADERSDINVLLIIKSPKLTLRCHLQPFNEEKVSLLIVDYKTFERDVDEDRLGGLLVENIITPYEPLVNEDYLRGQEVKAKKRLIIEILGNIVLEFPKMSDELIIKPEYFMFEAMMRKASLFPPITYRFLNILRSDLREKNHELMMKGFKAALGAVAKEGYITFSDEYVKITKDYINAIKKRRLRIVNLFKIVRSGILRHIFKVFPRMTRSFIEDYEIYTEHFMDKENLMGIPLFNLEDPKKHIFVPTPLGFVSLSDNVTIESFVRRTVPNSYALKVDIKKMGGVLNAVYTLRFQREMGEQKIVVKVFKDWYGWKWFPLALWSLGTRGFAVLGKSRLEREYTINGFLSNQGVYVPRILYISPKERLIFQEFVDGVNLTKIIKQTCSSEEEIDNLVKAFRQAGREIAKIHRLGVALGDCKPENLIITNDERMCFVDLEQAERDGDQAWDIAEFLYYLGHHVSLSFMETTQMVKTAQIITKEFIEGYLEAGGKIENLKKIRSPRYVKVFSFFTPPHLLLVISTACGEILKSRSVEK